jgi:hypothetical protein
MADDVVISMVAPSPVMRVYGRRLARRIRCRMDAQGAVDTANYAANHAANQSPNRSRGLPAHGRAMRDTVGNALRLRGQRANEGRSDHACEHNTKFHATTLSLFEDAAHVADNEGDCAARKWRSALSEH